MQLEAEMLNLERQAQYVTAGGGTVTIKVEAEEEELDNLNPPPKKKKLTSGSLLQPKIGAAEAAGWWIIPWT